MKRDGILWHSGVGGIRDFGSLIKIHVFFANDTFWNIFKHSTVVERVLMLIANEPFFLSSANANERFSGR